MTDDSAVAQSLEYEWVKRFHDLQKLPLLPEYTAMPPALRVYMRHDFPPDAAALKRPARAQKSLLDASKNTAYVEGGTEYNIWYGMSATWTPEGRKERIPALGHCQPLLDAGFTEADLGGDRRPLCVYFAKGICTRGVKCKYHHRVPTYYESECLPLTEDIFGRERFASHRDDMNGVGSFNSAGVTLVVGDYHNSEDLQWVEEQLMARFSIYGALASVKVIANRNFAFVTYCYRAAAEFALVAMNGWKLSEKDEHEILSVRWATGNEEIKAGASSAAS